MKRSEVSSLRLVLTLLMLGLLAGSATANHLHYIDITDERFPQNDPLDASYDPNFVLADIQAEPFFEWIVFTGNDDFTTISNAGLTMAASSGQGTVRAVFDAPALEDITNAQTTAFYEFEISALDTGGIQTIELALTDLANEIKWDEAAGSISGSKAGVQGDDVVGVPRWSAFGTLPIRIQLYYHFADHVLTFVVIDDVLGTAAPISWRGSANPFQNFFPDGIGGTNPDNLIVYPSVFCEAPCEVTALAWDTMTCDTAGDEVDVSSCRLLPGLGNGQIDPGELCDDGNVLPGDGCDENGQFERIGWRCQEAVARAGQRYAKDRLRNLQRCRNLLNRGATLFRDREKTTAIGDQSECPHEFGTASRLAKARAKAWKVVAAKCTDALVAGLAACGDTLEEVVSSDGATGCLIETHDAGVATLLTAEYGG